MIWKSLQLNVVSFCAEKFFQQCDTFFEVWSTSRLSFPAVEHDVIQLTTTVLWLLQAMTFANLEKKAYTFNNNSWTKIVLYIKLQYM